MRGGIALSVVFEDEKGRDVKSVLLEAWVCFLFLFCFLLFLFFFKLSLIWVILFGIRKKENGIDFCFWIVF